MYTPISDALPVPRVMLCVCLQMLACDALRCVGLLATLQCTQVGLVTECLLLMRRWELFVVMLIALATVSATSFVKGYRVISAIHTVETAAE